MTLSDKLKTMIEEALTSMRITSANPTHINHVIDFNFNAIADIDEDFSESFFNTKKGKEINEGSELLKGYELGNVGALRRLTKQQYANIHAIALNPFGFFTNTLLRKLTKGAGIAALALILLDVIKFAIDELMKPGRELDRRFRRIASAEIRIFTERQEQEELRLGFKQIIVTSRPFLRGGQGQISGNFYVPQGTIRQSFYQKGIPLEAPNAKAQGAKGRNYRGFRTR